MRELFTLSVYFYVVLGLGVGGFCWGPFGVGVLLLMGELVYDADTLNSAFVHGVFLLFRNVLENVVG